MQGHSPENGLEQRTERGDLVTDRAGGAQAEQPIPQQARLGRPPKVEARVIEPAEKAQPERLQHRTHDLPQQCEPAAKHPEKHGHGVVPELDDPRFLQEEEEHITPPDPNPDEILT